MSNSNDRLSTMTLKDISGDNITWRHMEAGNANSPYGREGVRYFAIKLDDEFANSLEEEGWPVIWRDYEDRDNPEQTISKAFLKVFIKYGTRFPVDIFLVNANRKTKTLLNEEDLDNLHIDSKTIESLTVMIRPYYWTYGTNHGIKCQVQAMNILLAQNGLDDDYEIIYPTD